MHDVSNVKLKAYTGRADYLTIFHLKERIIGNKCPTLTLFCHDIVVSEKTRIPWFGWTDNDEAATTDDWIDEEGLAFIIHPANALALAAAAAGGNGCIITPKRNISSSEIDNRCSYIDNSKKLGRLWSYYCMSP